MLNFSSNKLMQNIGSSCPLFTVFRDSVCLLMCDVYAAFKLSYTVLDGSYGTYMT